MTVVQDVRPGFHDYFVPASGAPLRQGDVLESADLDSPIWQKRLVVLTADCDFAHGKHQGRVTCVPVLDTDDYVLEFHMPAIVGIYAKKPLAEIQAAVDRAGGRGVSRERLVQWVQEDSTDEIIAGLNVAESKVPELARHIDALRVLATPTSTLADAIRIHASAIQMTGLAKAREEALARVKSDIRSRLRSLPGDALFLGSVGPGNAEGYFAYLRHIEQLWEVDVSVQPTRASVSHRRISRLSERLTDALAQKFGMVFMSIGLPTEYEDMRDLHFEALGEEIT